MEVTKWLNQGSLCNALRTLGERESGTILLEQAVTACRASLDEMKRDWAPFTWAAIQDNLGKTLWALKGPESGSARLEEAIMAWESRLTVATTVWPQERVQKVRSRISEARAEIARLAAK
jgi:hypothetical protein